MYFIYIYTYTYIFTYIYLKIYYIYYIFIYEKKSLDWNKYRMFVTSCVCVFSGMHSVVFDMK